MVYYNNRPDMAATAGGFLRSELKKRKMTQEQFAELAFADVRTINRWVNGRFSGNAPIETMSVVLRVSVRDILAYGEDAPAHIIAIMTV